MPPKSEQRLVLRRPDDWHVHLRDGEMLAAVVGHTARQFGRAIVMPNLKSPITTIQQAQSYRNRILSALPDDSSFEPLLTAYLTDTISATEIATGFGDGVFTACKLYPANATTNADHGVTSIALIKDVLETMQRIDMPLLIHGEVTSSQVDVFDREAVFIETVLQPLRQDFPELRVVLEHITTKDAVDFVLGEGPNLAATITPHHLEINRNAMFEGGLRPHMYCLPTAKREQHRLALRTAATSGNPKFFLGTDSAPHTIAAKESDCGCAGIFNAPFALEAYAKVFAEENALGKLEGFASEYGPAFYRLPVNDAKVVLEKQSIEVPEHLQAGAEVLRPFHAGASLPWRFAGAV
ncbi:MAG: dihydroorotase [Gammaproteobacteria bacterium]|nr:dihydroorotase [Gammaproteobacteria bacterium]MDH3811256.1 dihydroorotase [Gammaproteobacteria bacterium]